MSDKEIIKVEPKKKTKLAIVGFTGTRNLAHYDDPEFEIWTVNNLYRFVPRQDRIFELHTREQIAADLTHGVDGKTYVEEMASMKIPVYMQEKYPDIPSSIKYPLDKMVEEFGVERSNTNHTPDAYFTNSISFMLALGIYEGFQEIHIYGVDMAVGCLAPETKVLTADLRWVRSDEVSVGDELIGFDEYPDSGDGKTRKWRKTVVTKADKIKKPCYEIKLEDGTTFIASDKHGWLTHAENTNRWKTSEELVTRHHRRPTRIIKLLDTWQEEDGYEAGYLAAAFDGEGCLMSGNRSGNKNHKSCKLSFAQRKNEMKDYVGSLLNMFGFDWNEHAVNFGVTKQVNIKGGREAVMRFLGMFRPKRLLPKFDPDMLGELQAKNNVAVVSSEFVGERDVIGMETTTKTFIAEGFASHNSEYIEQRPSCEYYIGIAKGRGIKLYIPIESDLLKTRFIYGYDEVRKDAWMKKLESTLQHMHAQKNQSDMTIRNQQSVSDKYEGAITALNEMAKTWS